MQNISCLVNSGKGITLQMYTLFLLSTYVVLLKIPSNALCACVL
jgi:hypothetical protein